MSCIKRHKLAKHLLEQKRMIPVFLPCVKCIIGLKVRNAVREFGYELVSKEVDGDVSVLILQYMGTTYVSNPVKDYLHEVLLEQQCDTKML